MGFWDFASNAATSAGQIWGGKGGSFPTSLPVFDATVTGKSPFVQKQSSNMLLYAGLGGVGLIMMMFLMKK